MKGSRFDSSLSLIFNNLSHPYVLRFNKRTLQAANEAQNAVSRFPWNARDAYHPAAINLLACTSFKRTKVLQL